jgi:hypothetical protein
MRIKGKLVVFCVSGESISFPYHDWLLLWRPKHDTQCDNTVAIKLINCDVCAFFKSHIESTNAGINGL